MRIFAISALLLTASAFAQTGINNPMTRAVLDVYERQLKENPQDYETWMNRANEYYRHSEYMKALSDVDNALKCIPAKDVANSTVALMLRANIYTQTGRPLQALQDLNTVLALDPDHYVAIYQRANTHYSLGNFEQAKTDYTRLQRYNRRSPEALVGLARVAVKENNLGQANEYLEEAVAQDPNNSELYVRRASVRRDMGNDHGAIEDLILALATDSKNSHATAMLVDYGNVNYPAVIAGLTDAARQAPNVGMYPYLRAVIAQHHYNYKAALADYRAIVDKGLYSYQGIYRSIAECLFAMGRFDEALENVDMALSMDRNAADAALLRAKILRVLGQNDEALSQAASALAMLPAKEKNMGLAELAMAYAGAHNYSEAANLFAEATMGETDADTQDFFMKRAWLLGTYLNQPVAAQGFYDKVVELNDDEDAANPAKGMLGAFANLFNGKEAEAETMAQNIISANDKDPYILYLAACFYSAADNSDKALDYVAKALDAGYANYYKWNYDIDGRVNIATLRDDLRFLNLMSRNSHLW